MPAADLDSTRDKPDHKQRQDRRNSKPTANERDDRTESQGQSKRGGRVRFHSSQCKHEQNTAIHNLNSPAE